MARQALNALFQVDGFSDAALQGSLLSHKTVVRCGCLYRLASGVLGGVNGCEKEASDHVVSPDRVGVPLGIPKGARIDLFPAAYNCHG